jgi:hypothetical protein
MVRAMRGERCDARSRWFQAEAGRGRLVRVQAKMLGVLASLSCAMWPNSAPGAPVYRVAATEQEVEAVAVAAGRVFWTGWDGASASIYSSYPAGDLRRLLRVRVSQFDWISPSLWSSRARVVAQFDYLYSDPDAEYSGTLIQASGAVGARRLQRLGPPYREEQLHDVDGHRLVVTTVSTAGNRQTVRAFVRELDRRGTRPRAVGRPMAGTVGDVSVDTEVRIAGRYVAVLRHSRRPTIRVIDVGSNRVRWTVRLPRWRGGTGSAPRGRRVMWELARSGSVAVALTIRARGPSSRQRELGWISPDGQYQRLSGRVALREPFVVDGGILTYAWPSRRDRVRVVSRPLGQADPRMLSGEIPSEALIASDGLIVAAVIAGKGGTHCVLAARPPIPRAARWRC